MLVSETAFIGKDVSPDMIMPNFNASSCKHSVNSPGDRHLPTSKFAYNENAAPQNSATDRGRRDQEVRLVTDVSDKGDQTNQTIMNLSVDTQLKDNLRHIVNINHDLERALVRLNN